MGATGSKGRAKSKAKRKTKLKNFVNWFEIPAHDLPRAVAFYNHIYDVEMQTTEMNGYAMALFPADKGIGGAVVQGQGCVPSDTGTLVYLNGGKDLLDVLGRVEDAGGRVVLGKTQISDDVGYFAIFIDTEGNKLALHSKG